jgi:hypothetical protein
MDWNMNYLGRRSTRPTKRSGADKGGNFRKGQQQRCPGSIPSAACVSDSSYRASRENTHTVQRMRMEKSSEKVA